MDYYSKNIVKRDLAVYMKACNKDIPEPGFSTIGLKFRKEGKWEYYRIYTMPLWKLEDHKKGEWVFCIFAPSHSGMIWPINIPVTVNEKPTQKTAIQILNALIENAPDLVDRLREKHDEDDRLDEMQKKNNDRMMDKIQRDADHQWMSLKEYIGKVYRKEK